MKHDKWQELAALDAGNDLPPRRAERFRRHAETCPECRELAGALREQRRQLAALAADPADEQTFAVIRRSVLAAVAAERTGQRNTRPFPALPSWRRWAVVAGLAAISLLLWAALRQAPGPERTARARPVAARPAGKAAGAGRPTPPEQLPSPPKETMPEQTACSTRPPRREEPARPGREAALHHRRETGSGFAPADIRLPEIEVPSIDPKVIAAPEGQRAPIRLVADRPDLQIIWFNDNHGGIQ